MKTRFIELITESGRTLEVNPQYVTLIETRMNPPGSVLWIIANSDCQTKAFHFTKSPQELRKLLEEEPELKLPVLPVDEDTEPPPFIPIELSI